MHVPYCGNISLSLSLSVFLSFYVDQMNKFFFINSLIPNPGMPKREHSPYCIVDITQTL